MQSIAELKPGYYWVWVKTEEESGGKWELYRRFETGSWEGFEEDSGFHDEHLLDKEAYPFFAETVIVGPRVEIEPPKEKPQPESGPSTQNEKN